MHKKNIEGTKKIKNKTGLALYWDNNPTQYHDYNCLVVMKCDLLTTC